MFAIDRTLAQRVTCLERKSLLCTRHTHTRPVEILTFTLDGVLSVWIEQDETKYNVKIGADDIHLQISQGEVMRILGEL